MKHVPVLDGVRGLAILLVMWSHAVVYRQRSSAVDVWFLRLSGWGWVGVDLFFVLSGYLITGILLDTRRDPHYFRNFYARRVLRIFPLYYAILAISLFVLPRFLPAAKAARFGTIAGTEAYYWLYLQNWPIAMHGFRHAVLDITWSLAIEEQFYLVWPAAVFFLERRTLVRVIAGIVLAAPLCRGLITSGALPIPELGAYVLTPCRLDALVAGAYLAIRATEPGGLRALVPLARVVAPLAALSAVLVVVTEILVLGEARLVFSTGPISLPVGLTLNLLFFGSLLVLVLESDDESLLHRVFDGRFLRKTGFYAYALYLVHLPIRAVLRDRLYGPEWSDARFHYLTLFGSELPGQLLFLGFAFVPCFAVAWLSYELFEKRFLALKRFFARDERAPRSEHQLALDRGRGGP